MFAEILKYLSVFLLSMVKFFGGPVAGLSMGLNFAETCALTIAGMMTSVFLFSIIGSVVRQWYVQRGRRKNKKKFTKGNRRIIKIWTKFGVSGIAFLTPILFSPVVGTMLASVLGARRSHILMHMLWSSVFWGLALTFMLFKLHHLPFLHFLKH